MVTRREFVAGGLASAFALSGSFQNCPTAIAKASRNSSNQSLLVIHLRGGNDGLNTVVPYTSRTYYKSRPDISIPARSVLRLNDEHGFHPALEGLFDLYKKNKAAIFMNSGCEGLTKSHMRASEIWQSALPNEIGGTSWLERASREFDESNGQHDQRKQLTLMSPGDGTADSFSISLSDLARYLEGNDGPFAFHVVLDGFDTHVNQLKSHSQALSTFSQELNRLYKRLANGSKKGNLLTLVYSEFGRSIKQNDEIGTDHGAGGPCFLIGSNVKGGIYGARALDDDHQLQDLPISIDFRRVYANVLASGLALSS